MTMNKDFTKEDISSALVANNAKAEKILGNPSKAKDFIHDVQQWLKKHRDIPVLGKVLSEIENMLSLITDYIYKEYTDVPKGSIISSIACLIYVLSPIDLIPDFVPIAGYLDDVAVITLVLDLGLSKDLKDYRNWKKAKIDMRLLERAKSIVPSVVSKINGEEIVGVEILSDYCVRILTNSGETNEKPFECYAYLYEFNESAFEDDDIISYEDRINFIKLILSDKLIAWKSSCIGRIKEEHKFTDFDDYYIITDKE